MAIYQTGGYRVKATALTTVKQAIKEFVDYVRANEPGTQMYLAWQQEGDPTHFLHLFIFADAAAQKRHDESQASNVLNQFILRTWLRERSCSLTMRWLPGRHKCLRAVAARDLLGFGCNQLRGT